MPCLMIRFQICLILSNIPNCLHTIRGKASYTKANDFSPTKLSSFLLGNSGKNNDYMKEKLSESTLHTFVI